jgi:hypothetical protein
VEYVLLSPKRPAKKKKILRSPEYSNIHAQSSSSNHNANRETIIKGSEVENSQAEYPYVVSLLQRNWKKQAWHTCAGVLITPNIVLSAAHCYHNVDIAHIGLDQADHELRRRLEKENADLEHEQQDNADDQEEISIDDNQSPQENLVTHDSPHQEAPISEEALSNAEIRKRSLELKINNFRNSDSFGKAYSLRWWDKLQHPDFNPRTGAYD